MSDPATLTPPADAPLPWSVVVDPNNGPSIHDANGEAFAGIGLEQRDDAASLPVARYLVAAANAAPGLVSRADALATECEVLIDSIRSLESERDHLVEQRDAYRRIAEDAQALANYATDGRDTALARVAVLEDENARLLELLDRAAERLHPLDSDEVRRREDAIINGKDVTP